MKDPASPVLHRLISKHLENAQRFQGESVEMVPLVFRQRDQELIGDLQRADAVGPFDLVAQAQAMEAAAAGGPGADELGTLGQALHDAVRHAAARLREALDG